MQTLLSPFLAGFVPSMPSNAIRNSFDRVTRAKENTAIRIVIPAEAGTGSFNRKAKNEQ